MKQIIILILLAVIGCVTLISSVNDDNIKKMEDKCSELQKQQIQTDKVIFKLSEKQKKDDQQIRVLCVRTGISLSELARRINQTPQNFNAKLKRNTITQDELNLIAKVLDVTYEQYFVLGNGELVK